MAKKISNQAWNFFFQVQSYIRIFLIDYRYQCLLVSRLGRVMYCLISTPKVIEFSLHEQIKKGNQVCTQLHRILITYTPLPATLARLTCRTCDGTMGKQLKKEIFGKFEKPQKGSLEKNNTNILRATVHYIYCSYTFFAFQFNTYIVMGPPCVIIL